LRQDHLLNLISRDLTPSLGKILFDGKSITPLSTTEAEYRGNLFQFPGESTTP